VDSITSGLVAVLQSDATSGFIKATITDAGHSQLAVSYPCCSVTPTGFAYNSADGVYFADMFDAPSLHYHIEHFYPDVHLADAVTPRSLLSPTPPRRSPVPPLSIFSAPT
jgi:hypothetical protein